MALNRFMHPRNPYKNNRPDFKRLALEHEEFRKVAKQSLDGKVSIDFKDPACLKALSEALLFNDFGLSVELPVDRLIPAVPQRLNYLLWLEDLIKDGQKEGITGIDIGCGASCIYALLGCKKNKWKFITVEVDEVNLQYARENIKRNNYSDDITVLEQKDDSLLTSAVEHYLQQLPTTSSTEEHKLSHCIDFSMCNPPFFDTDESASSRGVRPEPSHVCTASASEKSVSGGEVEFVKKMIDESLQLRHRIRIYTSMVGKKSSLSKIKQYLRERNVPNFSITEFCQGRTMRWAVAWTFDEQVSFPKSLFQQQKSKGSAPLVYMISPEISCCVYDVPAITHHLKNVLQRQLEMKCTTLHQDVGEFVSVVTATKNTWSHSRRKRRAEKFKQKMRALQAHSDDSVNPNTSTAADDSSLPPAKRQKLDSDGACSSDNLLAAVKQNTLDTSISRKEMTNTESLSLSVDEMSSSDEKPLITFSLELKLDGVHIKLHLRLMDGEQKEMLNQILQYLKNSLI